mmetsp:Transcript_13671/g.18956  ORF Transcript_13671/g.18956 Transcript_13671/m.18956 type:complete len:100 (-) Transcript_13671:108-407(-)
MRYAAARQRRAVCAAGVDVLLLPPREGLDNVINALQGDENPAPSHRLSFLLQLDRPPGRGEAAGLVALAAAVLEEATDGYHQPCPALQPQRLAFDQPMH